MFEETKQSNNQNQEPAMPVAPPENINQRIERLHEQGKLRKNKKVIILAIVLFILIAGGASAGFMYRDKVSDLLGIKGGSCNYNNPDKKYSYENGDECARADIVCKEGENIFSDDCGCGCEVNKVENIDCPADAKQCPNGSFVARVAPDCEFAECPIVQEGDSEEVDISTILKNICARTTNNGRRPSGYENGEVYKCGNWDYIQIVPVGLLDASIHIYDNQGNLVTYCGEMPGPEPRKEPEECKMQCEKTDLLFCGEDNIDTSGWQTYRNEELGVEFKHPVQSSIEYIADSNVNKQIIQIRDYEAIISHDIEILENPSKLTSRQYAEKMLEDAMKEYEGNEEKTLKPYLLDYKEKRELTIADLPAYELYNQNKGLIYLAKDNLVYFFYSPIAEENSILPNATEINKIAKQIIYTFKFLTDTDSDGLYDDEEEKYGTDINNSDSDGDGYLDGSEVKNGFNPMGAGKLENL